MSKFQSSFYVYKICVHDRETNGITFLSLWSKLCLILVADGKAVSVSLSYSVTFLSFFFPQEAKNLDFFPIQDGAIFSTLSFGIPFGNLK